MNKIRITKKEKSYLEEKNVWKQVVYFHTKMRGNANKRRSSKSANEFLKEKQFDKYIEFLRRNNC